MNVLMVSKACVVGAYRRKLEEVAARGVTLSVVVPPEWRDPSGVRRLEEAGVTDVVIGFRWPYVTGPDTEPLAIKIDNLRRFADDVIAKA